MKTTEEWSNAFDLLNADYVRRGEFGLTSPLEFDEYEKSFFLTKALEEIVNELYNGNIKSFEIDEQTRRQLDSLIKLKTLETEGSQNKLNDKFTHTTFELENDCMYIIYEQALFNSGNNCIDNRTIDVIPVTHDEYHRTINNPFRGPSNKRVLRLDNGNNNIELISKHTIGNYTYRYLSKPQPIVLINFLDDDLSINGISEPLTCELSESIHQLILDRAVLIALQTRIKGNNNAS